MLRQCNLNTQKIGRTNRVSTGFTLIEVMIVVVILSVLAAMVVPRIMSRPGEARVVRAGHDIRAIEAALDLYRLDNFRYPTSAQGLAAGHQTNRRASRPKLEFRRLFKEAPQGPLGHTLRLSPARPARQN